MILTICLEQINQQELSNQLVQIYLTLLFGYLHRDFGDKCVLPAMKQKKDSQDYEILRYMNEHLQSISLSKLAEHFHYSEQYISRRVKQITGMAYSEYLTQCRMQEAGRLLTETTLKISVVGQCVGYNSPENFNRMFRKYYHISPGQYRAENSTNFNALAESGKDEMNT